MCRHDLSRNMLSYEILLVFYCSLAAASRYCYDPGTATVSGYCLDRTISSPGDVRILVLASIHEPESGNTCGQISPDVFQAVLAVQWIVDILNGRGNDSNMFIPGVNIGYEVYDDCGIASFTSDTITHALHHTKPESLLSCASVCNQTDIPLAGILAVTTTEATSRARALLPTNIPLITARAPVVTVTDDSAVFTTVPHIKQEYQAMVALLKLMRWNIIAILYSDDVLGQTMFQYFEKELTKSGTGTDICIVYSKSLFLSDTEQQFSNIYLRLGSNQTKQENETLGVLYLGNAPLLVSLLNYLSSKALSSNNLSSKLQWLLPAYIAEDLKVRDAISKFTQNPVLLSVLPYQRTLPDFEIFSKGRFKNSALFPNDTSLSPWIEKYIEQVYGGDVNRIDSEFIQLSHVYPVVKGLLSLAVAVKTRHTVLCDKTGASLCPSLRKYLLTDGLTSDLHTGSIHDDFRQSITPDLDNVTLHKNSGLLQLNDDSILQVSYCNNVRCSKFASYSEDGLKITSWFPHAPSRCGPLQGCSECIRDKLQYAYIPGDVLVLGLFSVRDSQGGDNSLVFTCGSYRSSSITVMTVSSFLHTVRSMNQTTSNGKTVGGIAIDDCYSPFNVTELLTNLFTKQQTISDPTTGEIIDFDRVIVVVGALSSKVSLIVADLMTSLKIPMISYGASSAGLDDRVRYPYFLRTVPSDTLQVAGLVDVLKKMDFTHVGAIYVDDPYGLNGIRDFKQLAEKSGICVEQEKTVSEKSSTAEIQKIMDEISMQLPSISDNSVRAVVFYSIDTIAEKILKALKTDTTKFTFIASEAWGTNGKLITGNLGDVSSGSLVLVTNSNFDMDGSFRTYLRNVTIATVSDNPWLQQYLETVFNCDMEGSFVRTRDVCRSSASLDDTTVNHIASDQRVVHVSHALYAAIEGFKSVCPSDCPNLRTHEQAKQFSSTIREVKISDMSNNQLRLFTSEGNGFIGFNIYNIQREEGGTSYVYKQVGSYTTDNRLTLDKSQIKLYRPGNPPLPIESNWTASCSPSHDRCAEICPVPQTSPPSPTTYLPVITTEATPVWDMYMYAGLGAIILISLVVNVIMVILLCRQKNNKMSTGLSQHPVMNRPGSLRSNGLYDTPRSQYSSIANLHTGQRNQSFKLEDRAPSTSSGIVPGSSNVSNGTTHRLELPVQYSGVLTPEAHKYGSKMSVNSYLSPAKPGQSSPKITISQDDSLLRRETESPYMLRSQSEGDISDDKALTYMTAKDLQMEDEDINYLDLSNRGSSQQTSPTSTGSNVQYGHAPRRLLPSLTHVNNVLSQTSPVRHQRPNTLPGIQAQIIPPENPPPYHTERRTAPMPLYSITDDYIQPTANTPVHSLSPQTDLVPVTTAYLYSPDGSSIPVLVTGSGEILSPPSTSSRSRVLPTVPAQHYNQPSNMYNLTAPFSVPAQGDGFQVPYQSSNTDGNPDSLGIDFENNVHSNLLDGSTVPVMQLPYLPVTKHQPVQNGTSLSHSPQQSSPNTSGNHSLPMITLSQAESPVMYATSPRPPVHNNYIQYPSKNLPFVKQGHVLPSQTKESNQSHLLVPLYKLPVSQSQPSMNSYQNNFSQPHPIMNSSPQNTSQSQRQLNLSPQSVSQLQPTINSYQQTFSQSQPQMISFHGVLATNNQSRKSAMSTVRGIEREDENEVMI